MYTYIHLLFICIYLAYDFYIILYVSYVFLYMSFATPIYVNKYAHDICIQLLYNSYRLLRVFYTVLYMSYRIRVCIYIYIYISIYFAVAAPQATGVGLQATAFVLQPEHVLKTTGIALQLSGFGRRRCSVCNSSQGVQYCSQRLYYCSQGSCYERQWLYYGYLSLCYTSQASALYPFVQTGCIICHKGCTMTQVG